MYATPSRRLAVALVHLLLALPTDIGGRGFDPDLVLAKNGGSSVFQDVIYGPQVLFSKE